jgi:hypothetical protein
MLLGMNACMRVCTRGCVGMCEWLSYMVRVARASWHLAAQHAYALLGWSGHKTR